MHVSISWVEIEKEDLGEQQPEVMYKAHNTLGKFIELVLSKVEMEKEEQGGPRTMFSSDYVYFFNFYKLPH